MFKPILLLIFIVLNDLKWKLAKKQEWKSIILAKTKNNQIISTCSYKERFLFSQNIVKCENNKWYIFQIVESYTKSYKKLIREW